MDITKPSVRLALPYPTPVSRPGSDFDAGTIIPKAPSICAIL